MDGPTNALAANKLSVASKCLASLGIFAVGAWYATVARAEKESWQIVSRVNGGTRRSAPVIFVRAGDTIFLEGRLAESRPNHVGSPGHIRWQEIKPVLRGYDNTRGTVDLVEYQVGATLGTAPTIQRRLGPREHGVHYYAISTDTPNAAVPWTVSRQFRTAESLPRAFPGRVVQVVCRPDDSYLGHLMELTGSPFIMGPGVTQAGYHQTDQRVGSDCAAFAIYGRRRDGFPVPYCGPSGILHYLQEIVPGRCSSGTDGVYRMADGSVVHTGGRGIRPGDIIHFGPQVSVFYQDRGISGTLDASDLLVQSWGKTPHVTTIRRSGFFQHPVRVMRWAK